MATWICNTDPGNDGDKEFTVEADNPEAAARACWDLHPEARELCQHSSVLDEGEEDADDPTHPEYPLVGKKVAWLDVHRTDLPEKRSAETAMDDRYWSYKYIRFESGLVEFFGCNN